MPDGDVPVLDSAGCPLWNASARQQIDGRCCCPLDGSVGPRSSRLCARGVRESPRKPPRARGLWSPRRLASKTNQKQREVAKATGTNAVASVRASVVLTHAHDLFAADRSGRARDDASAAESRKNFETSHILPTAEWVSVQVSGFSIDTQRCSPIRARSGGARAAQTFTMRSSTRHMCDSGSYLGYSERTGSAKSGDVTSLPCRRRNTLP